MHHATIDNNRIVRCLVHRVSPGFTDESSFPANTRKLLPQLPNLPLRAILNHLGVGPSGQDCRSSQSISVLSALTTVPTTDVHDAPRLDGD